MELAGLEPATSWVRSRHHLWLSCSELQGFCVVTARRDETGVQYVCRALF